MAIVGENITRILNEFGKSVNIVAATKMQSVETLTIAKEAGIKIFGENRVQELLDKFEYFKDMEWHFIGHLQTNKVKYIVDKVSLIHSVDSIKLANEISKEAQKISKIQDILLQVNIANEESKSGFEFDEIDNAISEINKLENVNIVGLMAMVPLASEIDLNRGYYRKMSDKYNELKDIHGFKYLSMGMSNDYELAIECGSNTIRIGSALFGARQYN